MFSNFNFGTMLWIVMLALVALSQCSRVTLRDNGYEGIVVGLDENISPVYCQEILHGLEDTIRSASSTIFRATRGRASMRSISVLVPSTWTPEICPILAGTLHNATTETLATSDVRVAGHSHTDLGDKQWTLQTRGCGQQGDYISFGYQFLLQNNSAMNGRLLAKDWIRYRYGVWDEIGEVGDPLHPPHYLSDGGTWRPNTCSNLHLQDSPDCDPSDITCSFKLSVEQRQRLSSSLLAFADEDSVSELCDEGSHNREAPTRHNLICGGQSVWEVLRASLDFQHNRNVEVGLTETEVKFRYVRPRPPRIVLLVEDTSVMNVQKRWEFMRKAVRKLVTYDIPDSHSVGLVVFNSASRILFPLTALTDGLTREKIGSALPRYPSTVGEGQRCLMCGLRKALSLLDASGSAAGGRIVLVTSGSNTIVDSEFAEASSLLTTVQVTLTPIVYPFTERYPRPSGGLERLAAVTGGRTYTVTDEGIGNESKLSMYYHLLDALYMVLSENSPRALPIKIHSAEHQGGLLQVSEGSFLVDDGLGPETVFAIFYYDMTHVGNLVHLVSPSGQVIDTTNMQKEDANINMITIRLSDSAVQPGLWKYKIENRADSHQALFVQVTSRPRNPENTLNIRGWTSHPEGEANATDISRPLALYAEIRMGSVALKDLIVKAHLTRLGFNDNGTAYDPIVVQLHDNGQIGPDMKEGDGVYSRYSPVLEAGKYSLKIRVGGGVNEKAFSRHVNLGIIDVIGSLSKDDVTPPSRIVDLIATTHPGTKEVTFSWTAPGNDFDYGIANRYVAMASTKRMEVLDGEAPFLKDWPVPISAGNKQTYKMDWEDNDVVYSVAMYAVDAAGNTASLSNIATVFVPSPPTTTTQIIPVISSSSENASKVKEGAWTPVAAALETHQLALILGCIGGLLFFVLLIVAYCIARYRCRRKKEETKKKSKEAQDSYNVTVTVASKGTDFPELKDDAGKKEFISPVESWSASQLLGSHDKRYSVSGRSDNTSDHSSSTKKSYGGSSGNNEYYAENNQYGYRHPAYPDQYAPPPSDSYPTPSDNYPMPGEGFPVPSEVRSYVGSQQSDSFLSVSCDPLLFPAHGPPGYTPAYPSYDSSLKSSKVAPPIPPKPKVLYTPEPYLYDQRDAVDGHSSTPSSSSERKIRNVTMV